MEDKTQLMAKTHRAYLRKLNPWDYPRPVQLRVRMIVISVFIGTKSVLFKGAPANFYSGHLINYQQQRYIIDIL